jgi:hypothetical protein
MSSLLAERAPSEGPRPTRVVEDNRRPPSKRSGKTGSLEKDALPARRTRTMKLCSSDARSEGQPGHSL